MLNLKNIKPFALVSTSLVLITAVITVFVFNPSGNDKVVASSRENESSNIESTVESDVTEQETSSEESSSSKKTTSKKQTPVVYEKPVPSELVNYYVKSIKVVKKPTKLVYKLGETIDLTGMQVIGYFSNGKAYDITEYVQTFWDTVKSVGNKLTLEICFTDWSEGINIASDIIYVSSVMPSLEVSVDNANLVIGGTAKLTATTDVDWPIEWYSDNTEVATIDAEGNITAACEGTANVYAVIKYNNGELKKSCAITVTV